MSSSFYVPEVGEKEGERGALRLAHVMILRKRRREGGGTEGALKWLKSAMKFAQATSEGETPGSLAGPRAEGREGKPQAAEEGGKRNKGWNN